VALTDTQKAEIRRALGWSARFHQFDSRLEQAMSAIATEPEHELQITDTVANHGILANIDAIQTELTGAHARLKANKVGSILLRPEELKQLKKEGDRWVKDLARILGVETRNGGLFGGARIGTFAGFGGQYGSSNYVGK
jgi:hypothetical protein